MKYAHTITITEFLKKQENLDEAYNGIKNLIPFKLEQEKIRITEETAQGFNEQPIKILTIVLPKKNHTKKFLEFLTKKLSTEQKKLLLAQKTSRTDEHLHFFIRINKESWNKNNKLFLTDRGNCIHINIALAAFPAKKDIAFKLISTIFGG